MTPIKHYPDDDNHLECHLPLPFEIKRGGEEDKRDVEAKNSLFKSETNDKWTVHLKTGENETHGINPSLKRIFRVKVNKNLNKIINYCFDIYEKSLELEKKRLEELRKKFGVIKYQKRYGVIAYSIQDFRDWAKLKRHNPKRFEGSGKIYEHKNIIYVALTRPEHSYGHTLDKIIETEKSIENPAYHEIKKVSTICLKKTRK